MTDSRFEKRPSASRCFLDSALDGNRKVYAGGAIGHAHGTVCQYNNMTMKSASGLEAIRMADDGRFDELRDYCADDVHILNNLYRQQYLKHPRNNQTINLSHYAPAMVYEKTKE